MDQDLGRRTFDDRARSLGRAFPLLAGLVAWMAVGSEFAFAEDVPRIRKIEVDHKGVFSSDERLDDVPLLPDLTFVFDLANAIHIDTREHVVRRELLVEEGDLAVPELIEESERNLRTQLFLRRPTIEVRPAGPGEVDLIVHTYDTWTTEPRFSFSGGGGNQKEEIGFVEKNVFGLGKRIVIRYRKELDRSTNQAIWDDPRILGSRFHLATSYEDADDGRTVRTVLEYPFFALATPFAGGVSYTGVREQNRIFEQGEVVLSRFRHRQESFSGSFGALLEDEDDGVVRRGGITYRYLDDDFLRPAQGLRPDLVPDDRRESAPGVFFTRQETRFAREKHLSLFDSVEDLNVGNIFSAEVGYSGRALGAFDDEPLFTLQDRQGFDLGPGQKAFLVGLLTGRYTRGDLRNAVVDIEGISFNKIDLFGYENTLVTRLKLDWGRNLDPDVQLFLGNDNGLRGFPTREFVGQRRIIFNFEDRVFFVNDLFHLVSLGMVFFFDAGNVWSQGEAVHAGDTIASVGLGLRVGLPRSAGEKVFRVDLAIPLTARGDRQFEPALSFGSGQAFSPFVGPFDLQTSSGE